MSAFTCSKFNNRNTKTRCEIYSKLTIKTPERHQTFLLLTLNMKLPSRLAFSRWCFTFYSSVSIVNFEHVIAV